eukprot:1304646-Pyramimonas_sp.AAC.2
MVEFHAGAGGVGGGGGVAGGGRCHPCARQCAAHRAGTGDLLRGGPGGGGVQPGALRRCALRGPRGRGRQLDRGGGRPPPILRRHPLAGAPSANLTPPLARGRARLRQSATPH